MLSQDEIPVSDASAQTRQTGGILTPLSDNSLNSNYDGLHSGKKRKRDGNTMEDLLKDSFIVKVTNSRPFTKGQLS
jgi:DNA replication regulator SLD3